MQAKNKFDEDFNLRDFLKQEGIDFKENSKHFYLSRCPNCNGLDKFFIDKFSKLWICYKCCETDKVKEHKEGRGNLRTLFRLLGISEERIKSIYREGRLKNYTGDFEYVDSTQEVIQKEEIEIYQIPKKLIKLDRSELQLRNYYEVYKYLFDRNVKTKNQFLKFDIHYDHYRKRVVFPAYNLKKECLGIQARDITNRWRNENYKCYNEFCSETSKVFFVGEEVIPNECPTCGEKLKSCFYPKSINSLNFPKTEFFFNENNVDWKRPVVLVEGPFDAINTENSLAFLGKVLSETQLRILMKNLESEIILYLDGDKAGDSSTVSIYNMLSPFFKVMIVLSENNEDPGQFSLEENEKRIKNAINPATWFYKKQIPM